MAVGYWTGLGTASVVVAFSSALWCVLRSIDPSVRLPVPVRLAGLFLGLGIVSIYTTATMCDVAICLHGAFHLAATDWMLGSCIGYRSEAGILPCHGVCVYILIPQTLPAPPFAPHSERKHHVSRSRRRRRRGGAREWWVGCGGRGRQLVHHAGGSGQL